MEALELPVGCAAPRPLLCAALAAAFGSLAGALAPLAAVPALLATALLGAGWWGWIAGRHSARGAPPGSRSAPVGIHALALACIALLGCARAALAECEALARAGATAGRWTTRAAWRGELGGSLSAHGGSEFQLAAGAVRDGEALELLPPFRELRAAAGPVASSRSSERREALPDQIVRRAPARAGEPWWQPARAALLRACDSLEDPELSALVRAAVCGDTSQLSAETADLFTRTGTRHLLAVSGQHVALVSALCLAPLAALFASLVSRVLPRVRVDAAPLATLFVFAYAPLAGGGSPVRRAALAFALAALAARVRAPAGAPAELGRRADALSLWGLALLSECLADPLAVTELSLQLSYAATLGLIVATGPIARALVPRGEAPVALMPSLARSLQGRALRAARIALAASLAAALATLPLSWSAFGEWSPIGVLATVAAVPAFALLVIAGWGLALFPEGVPSCFAAWAARALCKMLEVFDALPATPLPLPPRPLALLVAAGSLAFAALVLRDRGRAWTRCAAAAALAWASVLASWSPVPHGLELWALDVGHGTAVVLRAPGEPVWIFDAGSSDRSRVAQAAVVPLLAAWDASEISVVLSHGDRDHASALPWICERFRARLWAGALIPARAELALDCDLGRLRLPARPPLSLAVLRPLNREGNEGSRMLVVGWAGRTLVLCGDAEDAGLEAALEAHGLPEDCRMLLLPHHGSQSPWMGEWLRRTRPSEVWISASAEPAAVRELDRLEIPWRGTWRDGPLTLTLPP